MINLNQANQKNILSAEEAKNLGKQIENHEISKNIAIYTMPKRFRPADQAQTASRSSGFLVLLVGIVLLFLIGGGLYYYFFIIKEGNSFSFNAPAFVNKTKENKQSEFKQAEEKKTEQKPGGEKSEKQEQNTKTEDPEMQAAQEKYFQFQQALPAINTLSAYEQVVKQYFTPNFLNQFQQEKEKISNLKESEQQEFFHLLTSQQPDYSQLKQSLKPDKMSTTEVLLLDPKGKIKIDMKKVGGQWLIDSQQGFYIVLADNSTTTLAQWLEKKSAESQPVVEAGSSVSWQKAPDSDQDGLSDEEEKLLGTNISNIDTDQDGYSDYQELIHLYNPAGKGKLMDNPLMAEFKNQTFNFSFLYPAQWDKQDVDNDQSIIFKTDKDQFFQVVVQPNADNLDINTWYQKQFNVNAIKADQIITQTDKNGAVLWQGVKTDDGLTIYITSPTKDIIVTITYSPGATNTLYFSAIFDMILASLKFSL